MDTKYSLIFNAEQEFLDYRNFMQVRIQAMVERNTYYPPRVEFGQWPQEGKAEFSFIAGPATEILPPVAAVMNEYRLKQTVIIGPLFETQNRTPNEIMRTINENVVSFAQLAAKAWDEAFSTELKKHILDRSIARDRPLGSPTPPFPHRVNFWGKRVYPTKRWHGQAIVNPEYHRAAEQIIIFSHDTIKFQFLDPEKWAGAVEYRSNRLNQGYFQMRLCYGAQPQRLDKGAVVTVVPPGIRGWLWYKLWKLFKFVP